MRSSSSEAANISTRFSSSLITCDFGHFSFCCVNCCFTACALRDMWQSFLSILFDCVYHFVFHVGHLFVSVTEELTLETVAPGTTGEENSIHPSSGGEARGNTNNSIIVRSLTNNHTTHEQVTSTLFLHISLHIVGLIK